MTLAMEKYIFNGTLNRRYLAAFEKKSFNKTLIKYENGYFSEHAM